MSFFEKKELSEPHINLEVVQNYTLKKIEDNLEYPDLIVHLEETFPFRPPGILDNMILDLLFNGYDTIIAGKEEPGWMWKKSLTGNYERVDQGDIPRDLKKLPWLGFMELHVLHTPIYKK